MNQKSFLHLALVVSFLLSTFAEAAVNTSEAKLKIYKFAVSQSTDCSNPVTIFSSSTAQEVDMKTGPTLGSGSLNPGTYSCIIMEISDAITFKPAATENDCVSGTAYTRYVCQSGTTSRLIDGTSVTCTGTASSGEDRVAVYLSTMSTVSNPSTDCTAGEFSSGDCNAFMPPSATTLKKGLTLTSSFQVSGDTTSVMTLDTNGKISDGAVGGDACDMAPPGFGFATQ